MYISNDFELNNSIKFYSPYNLTTALYGQSDKNAASVVVVRANSNFKQFEDLKNAHACIAEYDGIGEFSIKMTSSFLDSVFFWVDKMIFICVVNICIDLFL